MRWLLAFSFRCAFHVPTSTLHRLGRAASLKKLAQYNSFVATYHVENFGCRATQADGAAIERQLLGRGLERASAAVEAEVVILNTCTVTASADQDVRAAIRRIHRENPVARILVTGCYAQRAPEELSALPGVSLVLGNSHKHELANYAVPLRSDTGFVALDQIGLNPASTVIVGDIFAHTELLAAPAIERRRSGCASAACRPGDLALSP